MKTVIRLLIFVLVLTGLAPVGSAYADCNNPSISSVTQTPSGNSVPQGTTLTFRVQANCGTIRIAANNNVFYELGSPDVTATFDTTPFGQSIVFMAQVRGDNQTWDQTNSRVWSVSVQPGSNPQPTSVGADLNGYCRAEGFDRVGTPGNAYSPRCAGGDQEVGIDMYALCEWQTGGAMPYPGLSDPYNWRTWTCNTNPTYIAPPPVEQPSQPSQPSNPQPSNPQPSGGNNNPSSGGSSNTNTGVCDRTDPVSVGGKGKVLSYGGGANRVRSTPSTSGTLLFSIPINGTFDVIGGPRCAGGYQWWQVSYNGQIGWTADGDSGGYWIGSTGSSSTTTNQPSNPVPSSGNNTSSGTGACAKPEPVAVGDMGRVAAYGGDPNPLRSGHSNSSTILVQMPIGATFEVISGPICTNEPAGKRRWWQVNYNGTTGWTSDGDGRGYWIESAGSVTQNTTSAQRCSEPVESKYDEERGGYILAIPLNPLPNEFKIYFDGTLVPNSNSGVRHDGYAGPADGNTIFLGISTRWAYSHWNWDNDNLWFFSYGC